VSITRFKEERMLNRSLLILCFVLLLLFCFINSSSPNDNVTMKKDVRDEEYLNEELPMIVIAYNMLCSRYESFKCLESSPKNPLIKMKTNIDAFESGISTVMAFTHLAFTTENNIEGHMSGFIRVNNKTLEESCVPFTNILFVTTPIKSYNNHILVILSSVSPDRTTVFSVGKRLDVNLLYDSFMKNEIKNAMDIKGTRTIGSIYGIRVLKPGSFLLQERMEPGALGFAPPYKNRIFRIDVTKGSFEITLTK
jgi:hypothetical protein